VRWPHLDAFAVDVCGEFRFWVGTDAFDGGRINVLTGEDVVDAAGEFGRLVPEVGGLAAGVASGVRPPAEDGVVEGVGEQAEGSAGVVGTAVEVASVDDRPTGR